MTHVLGVDASLNGTGLCWGDEPLDARSIVFKGRKGDAKGDQRLVEIGRTLSLILDREPFDGVLMEDCPPYGAGSASLQAVHGVIRYVVAERGVPLYLLSPSPLKKFATGNGKASKDEMRAAMPFERPSWDDNAVDAWWLREVGKLQPSNVADGAYDVLSMIKGPK